MKKILIVCFLLIVIGMSLVSCKSQTTHSLKFENEVIEMINQSETIDFSEITDFDWEELYIISPYTDVSTLLKREGIKCPEVEYTIEVSDTIYMFAFIDDNKLIRHIDLPIGSISFLRNLDSPTIFEREESNFGVSENRIEIDY